jgi:GAF domain-containing protein
MVELRRNEEQRLEALRELGLLDTHSDPEFDALVQEAAALLKTPIALVSLVDEHRQWFKARVGLDAAETPVAVSFCAHAIQSDAPMVVPDAREDARFADNPLVTGDPSIRFYAGAPLTTSSGWRVGTLCVIDQTPRPALTGEEEAVLRALADRVMALAERRG